MNLIGDITLNGDADTRSMRFESYKNFSVKACYYALNYRGVTILGNAEIWCSLTPKKCKIFAWLTLHNRLNTRERLARRNINFDSTYPFGCQSDENLTQLLFSCPYSSMIWQEFLIIVQDEHDFRSLQEIITNPEAVSQIHKKEWATILIAVTWNIWLAHNRKVFDNCNTSIRRLEEN
jgi:hypothetical protein